jgi:hypothetical protein
LRPPQASLYHNFPNWNVKRSNANFARRISLNPASERCR